MAATADAGTTVPIWRWSRTPTASDVATWRFTTPGPANTITWKIGLNNVDVAGFPQTTFTEPKFGAGGAPLAFAGFTRTDTGRLGSTATCTGTGSSTVVPRWIGTNHVANWTVTAAGTTAAVRNAGFTCEITAADPMTIPMEDLADPPSWATGIDVYLACGLERGAFASDDGVGMRVSLETRDRAEVLLDLDCTGTGATATGEEVPTLEVFRLRELDDHPVADALRPWTRDQLADAASALTEAGALSVPLRLGFAVSGLPVPTDEVAPGVGLALHIATSARATGTGEGDEGRPPEEDGGDDRDDKRPPEPQHPRQDHPGPEPRPEEWG